MCNLVFWYSGRTYCSNQNQICFVKQGGYMFFASIADSQKHGPPENNYNDGWCCEANSQSYHQRLPARLSTQRKRPWYARPRSWKIPVPSLTTANTSCKTMRRPLSFVPATRRLKNRGIQTHASGSFSARPLDPTQTTKACRTTRRFVLSVPSD